MWQKQSYEEIKQFNRIPRGMSTWICPILKLLVMLSILEHFSDTKQFNGTISKRSEANL
jgi:hypothetical protein